MDTFYLKNRDTRPILEVTLHDPAPPGSAPDTLGPVHDLTGSTAWELHIWLSDGTSLTRVLVPDGDLTTGIVRYTWLATDWDAGNLVVSPTLPLAPGVREHWMEYEVKGPTTARMTFPNGGDPSEAYDALRIYQDVGQAA